jgi:hypothetical protein
MFSGIGRIRTDLSGDPPFSEIVGRTHERVVGLFDNQDIPFMRVRQALLPDFPTGGPALAAALPIELQYFHTAPEGWAPGVAVVERPRSGRRDEELFSRGQLHPLSTTLLDDGTEMWGEVSYKLDFYDDETVEQLAESFERVLDAVGREPWLRLSELPVNSRRPARG